MSYLDVYIGFIKDKSDRQWYDDESVQNRQSPFFPPSAPFYKIIHMIKTGDLDGHQLDWGAWGAKVTKQQIFEIINEEYGDKWLNEQEKLLPWNLVKYHELVQFVKALKEDEEYAIIASEL